MRMGLIINHYNKSAVLILPFGSSARMAIPMINIYGRLKNNSQQMNGSKRNLGMDLHDKAELDTPTTSRTSGLNDTIIRRVTLDTTKHHTI